MAHTGGRIPAQGRRHRGDRVVDAGGSRTLHLEHPALRLPRVQGAHQGLAKHSRGELAGAARALRLVSGQRSPCAIPWWNSRPGSCRPGWRGISASAPPAACGLVVTWALIALTGIDMDHQLLPDGITLPLMWAGLLAAVIIGPIAGSCDSRVPARCHHRCGVGICESLAGVPRISPDHRQGRHGISGISSCLPPWARGWAGSCCPW